jgi:hypothetical protein
MKTGENMDFLVDLPFFWGKTDHSIFEEIKAHI